jgi:ABC-type branched-subunit amino acid transport system substrate-binding protein
MARRLGAVVVALVTAVLGLGTVAVLWPKAAAQSSAMSGVPLKIAVHVSSDSPAGQPRTPDANSRCAGPVKPQTAATPGRRSPEEVDAIEEFVRYRAGEINAAGGVAIKDATGATKVRRPIEVVFYDDQSAKEQTKLRIGEALAEPNLIGMVGLWNSSRGKGVVETAGTSGVPLISEWSDETLFAPYPNIFTLTRSVRDEKEVFGAFARDTYKRIAFIGKKGDLYTQAYHSFIESQAPGLSIVSTAWFEADGTLEKETEAAVTAAAGIKQSGADLLFLSIGRKPGAQFLKALTEAGVAIPAFVALGSIEGVTRDTSGGGCDYKGPLYEIAEGGVANLNNERLEELMRRPGRMGATREYSDYAMGYGARYADLVSLIAEAAAESSSATVTDIRNAVLAKLSGLAEGRRVWRGAAQDWSFTPDRASSERSLLVWRPPASRGAILAPTQYVRTGSDTVRVPVLYVHLDLMRISHVDSSDRSFEADFFLTVDTAGRFDPKDMEFTNAQRSPDSAERMVHVQQVHQDATGDPARPGLSIYRVSGRFRFEPNLSKYPFDAQIFSISFQPAKTSSAFLLQPPLLQPPADAVKKKTFSVDGWNVTNHYVGTKEQIIRSSSGPLGEERIISYYNFNYTWVMEREVVDYMLRVVVPLAFIILVAYVANFIPRSEFQAIMGIQVTALLSAIALYLALNQPLADTATLSDIIFVMAYAAISAMITLSVLEVNTTIMRSGTVLQLINILQIYLVPVATLATLSYVIAAAAYDIDLRSLLLRWRG